MCGGIAYRAGVSQHLHRPLARSAAGQNDVTRLAVLRTVRIAPHLRRTKSDYETGPSLRTCMQIIQAGHKKTELSPSSLADTSREHDKMGTTLFRCWQKPLPAPPVKDNYLTVTSKESDIENPGFSLQSYPKRDMVKCSSRDKYGSGGHETSTSINISACRPLGHTVRTVAKKKSPLSASYEFKWCNVHYSAAHHDALKRLVEFPCQKSRGFYSRTCPLGASWCAFSVGIGLEMWRSQGVEKGVRKGGNIGLTQPGRVLTPRLFFNFFLPLFIAGLLLLPDYISVVEGAPSCDVIICCYCTPHTCSLGLISAMFPRRTAE
uniref:Uncharacterized protein n=1 Tax=Timema tahoe TaxID=61484 RepID=A0A7R9IQV4_9NEOP|nr:unnamed protein product [Timema tahoe]